MHAKFVLTAVLLAGHLVACRVTPDYREDVDDYVADAYSPLSPREALGPKEAVGPQQSHDPDEVYYDSDGLPEADDEDIDPDVYYHVTATADDLSYAPSYGARDSLQRRYDEINAGENEYQPPAVSEPRYNSAAPSQSASFEIHRRGVYNFAFRRADDSDYTTNKYLVTSSDEAEEADDEASTLGRRKAGGSGSGGQAKDAAPAKAPPQAKAPGEAKAPGQAKAPSRAKAPAQSKEAAHSKPAQSKPQGEKSEHQSKTAPQSEEAAHSESLAKSPQSEKSKDGSEPKQPKIQGQSQDKSLFSSIVSGVGKAVGNIIKGGSKTVGKVASKAKPKSSSSKNKGGSSNDDNSGGDDNGNGGGGGSGGNHDNSNSGSGNNHGNSNSGSGNNHDNSNSGNGNGGSGGGSGSGSGNKDPGSPTPDKKQQKKDDKEAGKQGKIASKNQSKQSKSHASSLSKAEKSKSKEHESMVKSINSHMSADAKSAKKAAATPLRQRVKDKWTGKSGVEETHGKDPAGNAIFADRNGRLPPNHGEADGSGRGGSPPGLNHPDSDHDRSEDHAHHPGSPVEVPPDKHRPNDRTKFYEGKGKSPGQYRGSEGSDGGRPAGDEAPAAAPIAAGNHQEAKVPPHIAAVHPGPNIKKADPREKFPLPPGKSKHEDAPEGFKGPSGSNADQRARPPPLNPGGPRGEKKASGQGQPGAPPISPEGSTGRRGSDDSGSPVSPASNDGNHDDFPPQSPGGRYSIGDYPEDSVLRHPDVGRSNVDYKLPKSGGEGLSRSNALRRPGNQKVAGTGNQKQFPDGDGGVTRPESPTLGDKPVADGKPQRGPPDSPAPNTPGGGQRLPEAGDRDYNIPAAPGPGLGRSGAVRYPGLNSGKGDDAAAGAPNPNPVSGFRGGRAGSDGSPPGSPGGDTPPASPGGSSGGRPNLRVDTGGNQAGPGRNSPDGSPPVSPVGQNDAGADRNSPVSPQSPAYNPLGRNVDDDPLGQRAPQRQPAGGRLKEDLDPDDNKDSPAQAGQPAPKLGDNGLPQKSLNNPFKKGGALRSGGRFRGKHSGDDSNDSGNVLQGGVDAAAGIGAAGAGGGGDQNNQQSKRSLPRRDFVTLAFGQAGQGFGGVEMGYRSPEVSQALRQLVREHADAVGGTANRKRDLDWEDEDEGYVSSVESRRRDLEDEDEGYMSGDDSDSHGDFKAGFEYGLHMARAFM